MNPVEYTITDTACYITSCDYMDAFGNIKLSQLSLNTIQKFRSRSDNSYGKGIKHKITLSVVLYPIPFVLVLENGICAAFFKVTLPSDSSEKS